MMRFKAFLIALCYATIFHLGSGAHLDERYGYKEVRPGANMFYVLYESDGDCNMDGTTWEDCPLIMWLQGGPGSSGVGYGNFWELGPYDVNYDLRDWRWTKKANLLFVDQPVGSGYSYVDDLSLLTRNNTEIALDLVEFTKQLFDEYPELQSMPYYVYSESYGGKMTPDYALELYAEIQAGNINCSLKGVGIGDGWVSGIDSVNTWAPYLYATSFVNKNECQTIMNQADKCQAAIDANEWVEATNEWSNTEVVVLTVTGGVDFYNVFATEDVYSRMSDHGLDLSHMSPQVQRLYEHHVLGPKEPRDALGDLMNSPEQKLRWEIPPSVTWGGQSSPTFNALAEDFMKPVINSVNDLLDNTDIHVCVYVGDWDLICDGIGNYLWVSRMNWTDKDNFYVTGRVPMYLPETQSAKVAYYQKYNRFSLFTFLRSGHMVPLDAPYATLESIDMVMGWSGVTPTSSKQVQDQSSKKGKESITDEEAEQGEELLEEIEVLKQQIESYKLMQDKLNEKEREVKQQEETLVASQKAAEHKQQGEAVLSEPLKETAEHEQQEEAVASEPLKEAADHEQQEEAVASEPLKETAEHTQQEEAVDSEPLKESAEHELQEEAVASEPRKETAEHEQQEEAVASEPLKETAEHKQQEEAVDSEPLKESAEHELQEEAGASEPLKETAEHEQQEEAVASEPLKETAEHEQQEEAVASEPLKETAEHTQQGEAVDSELLKESAEHELQEEAVASEPLIETAEHEQQEEAAVSEPLKETAEQKQKEALQSLKETEHKQEVKEAAIAEAIHKRHRKRVHHRVHHKK